MRTRAADADRDFEGIARCFPLKRVAPNPRVRELTAAYPVSSTVLSRRRASTPRRSSRAGGRPMNLEPSEMTIHDPEMDISVSDFEARRPDLTRRLEKSG